MTHEQAIAMGREHEGFLPQSAQSCPRRPILLGHRHIGRRRGRANRGFAAMQPDHIVKAGVSLLIEECRILRGQSKLLPGWPRVGHRMPGSFQHLQAAVKFRIDSARIALAFHPIDRHAESRENSHEQQTYQTCKRHRMDWKRFIRRSNRGLAG